MRSMFLFLSIAVILVSLNSFSPAAVVATGPFDTSQFKLNQSIEILSFDNDADEVYIQGIKEGLEALFIGNFVILPTQNDGTSGCVSCDLFDKFILNIDRFISALSFHIVQRSNGTHLSFSRAAAIQARNFVQLTKESLVVLGEKTGRCNPASADADPDCAILNVGDNAGTVTIPSADGLNAPRHPFVGEREVRSPFFISKNVFETGNGNEHTFAIPTLSDNTCTAIMKELRGIKVSVKPRRLVIWQHPWYQRQTLINGRLIWTWEWVPAEFIKTITVCKRNETLSFETTIQTQLIHDSQLLSLWRILA